MKKDNSKRILKRDLYLHTKNLILRPFKKSDAKDIKNNLQYKVFSKNVPTIPYPYNLKDANDFIQNANKKLKEKKPTICFAIYLKNKNRVIGGVNLNNISFKNKNAESGSYIAKDYWGSGYIYEAKLEVYKYAFFKLGLRKIYSKVLSYNIRSKKHLLKLSFQEQGYLKKHVLHKGRYQDFFYLELLKEDFHYRDLKKELL